MRGYPLENSADADMVPPGVHGLHLELLDRWQEFQDGSHGAEGPDKTPAEIFPFRHHTTTLALLIAHLSINFDNF